MLKNTSSASRYKTPTHSRQNSITSQSPQQNSSLTKPPLRRTSCSSSESPLDYTSSDSKQNLMENSNLYSSVVEKDQNRQIRRKDVPLPNNSMPKKTHSRQGSYESVGKKENDKRPSMASVSSTYNSSVDKGSDIDTEISERMAKLQNELNALNMAHPGGRLANGQVPSVKYTSFLEIVGQLREIIHKLQLKDAVQRQELTKLRKSNSSYKNMVGELEQKVHELEKLREQDIQYLLKLDNFLLYEKQRAAQKPKKSAPKGKNIPVTNVTNAPPNNQMHEIKDAIENLNSKISGLSQEKEKLHQMFKRITGDERQIKVETIEDHPNPIHYYSTSANDKPFITPQYPAQPVVHEWNESGFDQATYDMTSVSTLYEKNEKNTDLSQVEPVTMGDIDNEEDQDHQDTAFSQEQQSPPNGHSFTLQAPKREQVSYLPGPYEGENKEYSSKKGNYRSEDLPLLYKERVNMENQFPSEKESEMPKLNIFEMNQSNRGSQPRTPEKRETSPGPKTPKTVYTKLSELDLNRFSSKSTKRPFESEPSHNHMETVPSGQVTPFEAFPQGKAYETRPGSYEGYDDEPQLNDVIVENNDNNNTNRDMKSLRLLNANPAVADIISDYKQSLLDSLGSGKVKESRNNIDSTQYSSNGVSYKPENRRYSSSNQESIQMKTDTKEYKEESIIKRNNYSESECEPIDAVDDEKADERRFDFDEYCSKICMDINAALMEQSTANNSDKDSNSLTGPAVGHIVMKQRLNTQEPYGSQVQNQLSSPPMMKITAVQRSGSNRNGAL